MSSVTRIACTATGSTLPPRLEAHLRARRALHLGKSIRRDQRTMPARLRGARRAEAQEHRGAGKGRIGPQRRARSPVCRNASRGRGGCVPQGRRSRLSRSCFGISSSLVERERGQVVRRGPRAYANSDQPARLSGPVQPQATDAARAAAASDDATALMQSSAAPHPYRWDMGVRSDGRRSTVP